MADVSGHSTFDETVYSDPGSETEPTEDQPRFRMRAWNPVLGVYEFWLSRGHPNLTPPSGQAVQLVTVFGRWEA